MASSSSSISTASKRSLKSERVGVSLRVAAIELVGAAIAAAPVGSAQADRLITAAVGGWEAERRAHVDTAYASALRLTVPQLRGSAQLARARALAVDHQIGQLTQLLHQLAADLE